MDRCLAVCALVREQLFLDVHQVHGALVLVQYHGLQRLLLRLMLLLVCLPSLVILAGFGPGPRHYSLGSLAQVIVRLRMDQVLADLEALVQADDELVLLRLLNLEVFYQS